MRGMTKWVALLVVGAALVAATEQRGQGQDKQRGGFPGGRGIVGIGGSVTLTLLLGTEGVQNELKMTDEQKTKSNAFFQEQLQARGSGPGRSARDGKAGDRGAGRGDRGGIRGGFDRGKLMQRGFTLEQLAEQAKTTNQAARAFAKENLKPEQQSRLEGIYYQNAALAALAYDEVLQAKLTVTPEQKTKFQSLIANQLEDGSEILKRADGSTRSEVEPKLQQLQMEYRDKALALLNDAQKKTWTELVGAPYTVPVGARGRRGGGGE